MKGSMDMRGMGQMPCMNGGGMAATVACEGEPAWKGGR